MEINCKHIVDRYLLNQNPLYSFSFPLSLLIAIIVFGFSKVYKWSDNSYIIQILIPLLTFFLSMVLIDIISRSMISSKERNKLIELCTLWRSHNNNDSINEIDMDIVINYNGIKRDIELEKFTNQMYQEIKENEVAKSLIDNNNNYNLENTYLPNVELSVLSPFPLEAKPDGTKCIQNSNCCNLCSGTNDNPCNVVAPIPGPSWMPESAETVQNRLKNNQYTESKCPVK